MVGKEKHTSSISKTKRRSNRIKPGQKRDLPKSEDEYSKEIAWKVFSETIKPSLNKSDSDVKDFKKKSQNFKKECERFLNVLVEYYMDKSTFNKNYPGFIETLKKLIKKHTMIDEILSTQYSKKGPKTDKELNKFIKIMAVFWVKKTGVKPKTISDYEHKKYSSQFLDFIYDSLTEFNYPPHGKEALGKRIQRVLNSENDKPFISIGDIPNA